MKHAIRYHACRLFGHAWNAIPSDWIPRVGTPLSLRCGRCGMERRDCVERRSGNVLWRTYIRPKDYLYERAERPTRSEFRAAWVERAIKEARNRKVD